MNINDKLIKEIVTAERDYGHFNSTHEVYGVLKEEVDEFFDCIKDRQNKQRHIHELTQIASICLRAIDELENNKIRFACQ